YMLQTINQDRPLNSTHIQNVNQYGVDTYGNKTVSNYLSPAAFEAPALGKFGNVGSGSIVGPGTWQFDVALSGTFLVREGQRMEFRAEAFNVTNSSQITNPPTTLNSNTFGQV